MSEQFKKQVSILLLASGDSTRFSQGRLPKKQWLRVGEFPLWQHLARFFASLGFGKIFIAMPPSELGYAKILSYGCPWICVEGGQTRSLSILQALPLIDTPYVLIHDVARFRPLEQVIDALLEKAVIDPQLSCIAPRIPLADTLYHQDRGYPPREGHFLIQTPQLSKTTDLCSALSVGEFSDESSAISARGGEVGFVDGSSLLHKLTHLDDLRLFSLLMPPPTAEIQMGQGVDIHAFEEGKAMRLCGVEIENGFGFRAHSDGDVAIHSLIDAILGAIGAGDIGEWFPDTDARYKGVDSQALLQEVMGFVRGVGYGIESVDLSFLAQTPKISPYKQKMREKLSALLSLAPHRISIKATTGEGLGFVGREEGLCVLSIVSLKPFDWSAEP